MGNNIETSAQLVIKDLIVLGKHGATDAEREKAQRFRISCTLKLDLEPAMKSDDLNDTVNWSTVRKQIISVVQHNSYNLMERLADEICQSISKDTRIQNVSLFIEKIDAYVDCIPAVKVNFVNHT